MLNQLKRMPPTLSTADLTKQTKETYVTTLVGSPTPKFRCGVCGRPLGLIQTKSGGAVFTADCCGDVAVPFMARYCEVLCELYALPQGSFVQLWKGPNDSDRSLFRLHSCSINSGMLMSPWSYTRFFFPRSSSGLITGLHDGHHSVTSDCVSP